MTAHVLRRRLLLAGVLVAFTGSLLLAGLVQLRSTRARERLAAQRDAARAELMQRASVRIPLWHDAPCDELRPVGVEYSAALDAIAGQHDALVDLVRRRADKQQDTLIAAASVRRAHWQTALRALRQAAATPVRSPFPDAAFSSDGSYANLLRCRDLANAAAFEAMLLLHEGQPLEAVRTSLDAVTLGLDLVRDGLLIQQMIGVAVLEIGLETWGDDVLRGLDRAARDELARGLASLDAQMPVTTSMTRELQFGLDYVLRAGSDWPGTDYQWSMWRHGGSTLWALDDAYTWLAAACRTLETTPGTWRERHRALEALAADALAHGNPMLSNVVPNYAPAERSLREALARVRLLRCALALHAGDDPTTVALDNPLAEEPLRPAPEGEAFVVQAIAPDFGATGRSEANRLRRTVRR
jgi:hypothetical protein